MPLVVVNITSSRDRFLSLNLCLPISLPSFLCTRVRVRPLSCLSPPLVLSALSPPSIYTCTHPIFLSIVVCGCVRWWISAFILTPCTRLRCGVERMGHKCGAALWTPHGTFSSSPFPFSSRAECTVQSLVPPLPCPVPSLCDFTVFLMFLPPPYVYMMRRRTFSQALNSTIPYTHTHPNQPVVYFLILSAFFPCLTNFMNPIHPLSGL